MSENMLVVIGIFVTIVISIVNILGLIWVNDNTEEIVKGENESVIHDHVEMIMTSIYGISVIGGLTIIASMVQLYLIMIRDGMSKHKLTVGEYGNYIGVITIFSIFALIASVSVNDTIDPERDTGDDPISLFDFIKVLIALNTISLVGYVLLVVFFVPSLPKTQPSVDAKFEFNF